MFKVVVGVLLLHRSGGGVEEVRCGRGGHLRAPWAASGAELYRVLRINDQDHGTLYGAVLYGIRVIRYDDACRRASSS